MSSCLACPHTQHAQLTPRVHQLSMPTWLGDADVCVEIAVLDERAAYA